MRAFAAYEVCRRRGIIREWLSYRDFKWLKRLVGRSWSYEDYIRYLLLALYLTDALPTEGLIVPELRLHIGGAVHLRLRPLDGLTN